MRVGFARDRPCEGAYQDIFVKALAFGDGAPRAVLITSDPLFFGDVNQGRIERGLCEAAGLEPH
jgi:hypothetical protein